MAVDPRRATLPPLWAGTSRAFCSRLEIEMQPVYSVNPDKVTLEWSDDGGCHGDRCAR